ncbi:hypothetical protein AVEN_76497-1 [Araneus ventricosus]|uniref:Uncharacterized protein n=1 Tax=Araneus ventricosus TaxID=182803 RepID=A0A4Y2CFB5_ARAVE|nr:hypothetical protein AVEN_76497-1 [Araneus ventricosus]
MGVLQPTDPRKRPSVIHALPTQPSSRALRAIAHAQGSLWIPRPARAEGTHFSITTGKDCFKWSGRLDGDRRHSLSHSSSLQSARCNTNIFSKSPVPNLFSSYIFNACVAYMKVTSWSFVILASRSEAARRLFWEEPRHFEQPSDDEDGTPELAPVSPNFRTTSAGGHLTLHMIYI